MKFSVCGEDIVDRGNAVAIVAVLVLGVVLTQFTVGSAVAGLHSRPSGLSAASGSPARRDAIIPGVVIIKLKRGYTIPTGILSKTAGGLTGSLVNAGVATFERMFPSVATLSKNEIAAGRTDISLIYQGLLGSGRDPREVSARIARLPGVEYAEPKYFQYLDIAPNDPQIANQLAAFTRLNLPDGWGLGKGDRKVVIADVDGGTYWQHEDLSPNLWINSAEDINHNGKFDPLPADQGGDLNGIDDDGNGSVDDIIGWNFTNNSGDPSGIQPKSYAHGTATASHFGAATDNNIGMAGSSWNCSLMPICTASATTDNAIQYGYEGIVYAYRNGAKIINCSWGHVGGYSQAEQDVIDAATQGGALVVAAAGNDQLLCDLNPQYPSSYRNVLSVGATNSTNDAKAWFSNYGSTVPVYAPGVSIWSALTNGGYGNGGDGTSYSSPLVAGIAGILKSVHPSWSPRQIATQLRVTADPIDGSLNPGLTGLLGHGRVNAARALAESHPGIEILNASMKTPSGKKIFRFGSCGSRSFPAW